MAKRQVRVNCVAPGVIRTAFHNSMPASVKENNLQNRIPLHCEGTAEQTASLMLEMVTNDYITGETFSIDGGAPAKASAGPFISSIWLMPESRMYFSVASAP